MDWRKALVTLGFAGGAGPSDSPTAGDLYLSIFMCPAEAQVIVLNVQGVGTTRPTGAQCTDSQRSLGSKAAIYCEITSELWYEEQR